MMKIWVISKECNKCVFQSQYRFYGVSLIGQLVCSVFSYLLTKLNSCRVWATELTINTPKL